MAGGHIVLADIKLLAQTPLQLNSAACELEGTNAQKTSKAQLPVKDLFNIYFLFVYSQCL